MTIHVTIAAAMLAGQALTRRTERESTPSLALRPNHNNTNGCMLPWLRGKHGTQVASCEFQQQGLIATDPGQ